MVGTATSEPSEQLVLQRIRNRIIEHLELISSYEEQREYQRNVPHVYVPYEIICGWEDWVRESRPPDFRPPVFNKLEIDAIELFHLLWDRVADQLPDDYPEFEEVLASPYWADLRDGAAKYLEVFLRRGKFSEDVEVEDL